MSHGGKRRRCRCIPQFRRVLPLLSSAACRPDLPATAFRRDYARPGRGPLCAFDAEFRLASRWHRAGLPVRLDRPLLFREEPTGDLYLPALQLRWRLGDVERHAHRTAPLLMMNSGYSFTDLLHSEVGWLAVLALALTALLLRFRPHERGMYLNTLWLFLIGVFGQGLAFVFDALAFATVATVLQTIFRIVAAIGPIRLVGFAVFRLVLPMMGREWPRIIEDLVILVAYVVYGFVQLRGAGVDLSSLVTTSAILTAVIAFAMQDTLGNVLGGLAFQVDNSVQVGDWVQLDTLVGRVRDIRWRSTLIETRNWETVVIPNSQLMKSRFAILGRREGSPLQWRRILNFMVDPGVPPARVIALVNEEMREVAIPNVARMPAASCVLYRFDEGNLCYQLRYFLTNLLEDDFTDSMVRVHLFASLQRAGIRIADPQRTVHAVQRDEAHAQTVRKRELSRRL